MSPVFSIFNEYAMSLLEELIAAILKDLAKAQHQANKQSAQLARLYHDPPIALV